MRFVQGLTALFLIGHLPVFADVSGVRLDLPTDSQAIESDEFVDFYIQGFTVRIGKSVFNNPRLNDGLAVLRAQLTHLVYVVPPAAVEKLREITIWVSDDPSCPFWYHVSPSWLQANGRNPDMALGVELCTPDQIVDTYGDQPAVTLHELAHGYHHQFLDQGFENPELIEAYNRAKTSGLYDEVLHIHGGHFEPYAMTNVNEFFAEMSEAFFMTNDYFPFVQGELRTTDPDTFNAIGLSWSSDSTWSTCDLDGQIRSESGDIEVTLNVTNATDQDRRLIWVDCEGRTSGVVRDLTPRSTYQINTYISHIWVLQDGYEDCLAYLTVGKTDVEVKF